LALAILCEWEIIEDGFRAKARKEVKKERIQMGVWEGKENREQKEIDALERSEASTIKNF
jgi:hypothetical protein